MSGNNDIMTHLPVLKDTRGVKGHPIMKSEFLKRNVSALIIQIYWGCVISIINVFFLE